MSWKCPTGIVGRSNVNQTKRFNFCMTNESIRWFSRLHRIFEQNVSRIQITLNDDNANSGDKQTNCRAIFPLRTTFSMWFLADWNRRRWNFNLNNAFGQCFFSSFCPLCVYVAQALRKKNKSVYVVIVVKFVGNPIIHMWIHIEHKNAFYPEKKRWGKNTMKWDHFGWRLFFNFIQKYYDK